MIRDYKQFTMADLNQEVKVEENKNFTVGNSSDPRNIQELTQYVSNLCIISSICSKTIPTILNSMFGSRSLPLFGSLWCMFYDVSFLRYDWMIG